MWKKVVVIVVIVLALVAAAHFYYKNMSPKINANVPANNSNTFVSGGAGDHCGGNIMNPPTCRTGFHCAPNPDSHLPFGDVGGICVADSSKLDLNTIFDLGKKVPDAKIYYSDKLGVGFTYVPSASGYSPVTVTEISNKIYVHAADLDPTQGQSIEVFPKDPKLTLQEAIKAKFLVGYDPKDCFVKTYDQAPENPDPGLPNYAFAGISFPLGNDANEPWWQNAGKCPANYSETNGIQYFVMNKDVPNKFAFVVVGQDSIAPDGTPTTPDYGFNWSHSLQILQ